MALWSGGSRPVNGDVLVVTGIDFWPGEYVPYLMFAEYPKHGFDSRDFRPAIDNRTGMDTLRKIARNQKVGIQEDA